MGTAPGLDLGDIDIREDFRNHVFGCFIDDAAGIGLIDMIGDDNIMIETDYPHSDSTWPGSLKLAKERIGHCRSRPSTRSCGATPSACSASHPPSRQRWSEPPGGNARDNERQPRIGS